MARTSQVAALAAIACLVGSGWLLFPRESAREEGSLGPPLRIALVDASASVRRRRPDWLPWVRRSLREEAEAAAEHQQDLAVLVYAAEVRRRFGPATPAAFLRELHGEAGAPFDPREGAGDELRSELHGALRAAAELGLHESGRAPGAVVILGDAGYSGSDPRAALEELREGGMAVRWRPPPAPPLADLALLELRAPQRLEEGAPLTALARLRFAPGTHGASRGTLFLEIANGSERHTLQRPLELPREPVSWTLPVDCGAAAAGRTVLRARVELAEGPDPVPENDRATASCVAEGEKVVGVVAHDLALARSWLAPAGSSALIGIEYLFVEPLELPRVLGDLDALISLDLPLALLPERPLEGFVEGGGGWLALSGWNFLHDWSPGLSDALLHRLLPLAPAPLEQGPREVVLLVDGSGSMEGEPFETVRAASLELVAASLPGDEVSLRFFTAVLEREHRLKERGGAVESGAFSGEAAARRLLEARVPGGSTHILDSLRQFADRRAGASEECLALLLTDGRERGILVDPPAEAAELLERLRQSRTRLVVIAVGETIDEDFLSLLTASGEEVERGESLEDLSRIFRREISGAQWREGKIPVRRRPSGAGSLGAEIFLSRAASDPPELARIVRTTPRPGAEVLWSSERDEPLLAVQRRGLGRVALCASAPLEDWAPRWAATQGLGEPRWLAPVLRWLSRGEASTRSRPRPEARLEGAELVVDGLETTWPARLGARVLDADPRRLGRRQARELASLVLELPPSPSGVDPRSRRRAPLPAELRPHAGESGLWIALSGTGEEEGELWLPLPMHPSPELAGELPPLDLEAWSGPGRKGPAGSTRQAPSGFHPAGPALLLAGILLWFAASLRQARGQVGR
jgi:hypothetical protein